MIDTIIAGQDRPLGAPQPPAPGTNQQRANFIPAWIAALFDKPTALRLYSQ
jgi:hypothetical protein